MYPQIQQDSLPYPSQPQGSPLGFGEVLPYNETADPPGARAAPPLPVKDMDPISGYQNMQHSQAFIPPPPTYEEALKQPNGAAAKEQFTQRPQLSQEEARACLFAFVKSQPCWSDEPVKSMAFQKIQSTVAVHYVLTSYVETRATDWAFQPYTGQPVDSPQFGYAPRPWDIVVQPPPWFEKQVIVTEVPHTASVKLCHGCKGQTSVFCRRCNGWGYNSCRTCGGDGRRSSGQYQSRCCYACNGSGRRRCCTCEGMGRIPCTVCEASGRLKFFIQLTSNFNAQAADFIIERTPLPDQLIRNVQGTIAFEDTQPVIHPLRTHPDPEVNRNSQTLVHQHGQLARSGRIWMQNHILREVPVFQCDCTYQGKPLQFYVYGHNRHVFLFNYPKKSCCKIL